LAVRKKRAVRAPRTNGSSSMP